MLFPSPEEIEVSNTAAMHRNNEKVETSRRASEITTPDEVVDFILEIARKKFSRGKHYFTFEVTVPIDNFTTWAVENEVSSENMGPSDRQKTRKVLTTTVQDMMNLQLADGTTCSISTAFAGSKRLNYMIGLSIR